ncbi:MAG TPA: copper-containing nitrite reductase [Acidobacteriaceae bacterium]|nr:copper-containing nitrite reductase [Acidobacteriaceae bacterium]
MKAISDRRFLSLILTVFLASAGSTTFAADHGTNQSHPASTIQAADIVRDPSDLPPPIGDRPAGVVHVVLTAREVTGVLDPSTGTTYRYWTFNGKVPGPFIRVRQGDTVEVTLQNDKNDMMVHSIDLHAALGPGGGAVLSQVPPGQSKTFSFQATIPGLFVYHCGTPMVADHIANGMYGLILIEPPGGLPHVDHEYYVMQGEIYTSAPKGKSGLQQFSEQNLVHESPEYFVYNGSVGALSSQFPLHANVGETVRIFFGNAGPNATASEHMIGEIFTKVYLFGSLTSAPLNGVQTAGVPPGDAAILDLKAEMPGKFTLMDHAMARMDKGLLAVLTVKGQENTALMHEGPASPPMGTAEISGMTAADLKAATEAPSMVAVISSGPSGTETMAGMSPATMDNNGVAAAPVLPRFNLRATIDSSHSLVGCMSELNDGKTMLKLFHSQKVYRLEAQPLLFSQNAGHLVHVTGHFGSVVLVEDPHIPSYVVDTVDSIADTCSSKTTVAEIEKALAPPDAPIGGMVTMGSMSFVPATITITAGQQVVWKNGSAYYHNVVDDPQRVLNRVDVSFPSGSIPFGSPLVQPGTSFYHVFDKPGTYHYVCVLHESSGMKGTVIVRPGPMIASASGKQSAGR